MSIVIGILGASLQPSRYALRPRARALASLEALGELVQLALERPVALPAVARERAVGEGGPHGAARLGLVPAVGEPAVRGELGDVVERVVETVVADPEMHLAHAGVVDEEPAAGEEDELAPRRRVPPGAVRARRSPVASRASSPISALTSVDFPTPEGPRRTPVVPAPISERIRVERRHRSAPTTKWIGNRAADARRAPRRRLPGRRSRSAFVRTIAGRAPLSSASAR